MRFGTVRQWMLATALCAVVAAPLALGDGAKGEGTAPKAQQAAPAVPVAVFIRDTKTGMLRAATAAEVAAMAAQIDRLLDRSSTGLSEEKRPDGSVTVDMKGHFQHGTLARIGADGKLEKICTDDAEQAKAFLGLIPARPATAKAEER